VPHNIYWIFSSNTSVYKIENAKTKINKVKHW